MAFTVIPLVDVAEEPQYLTAIRKASASAEQACCAQYDETGNFHAYDGIPPKLTAVKFPYSYRLWAGTEFGDPENDADVNSRRVIAGTKKEDTRVHTLWIGMMLAERADAVGLAALDWLLTMWPDVFRHTYRANSQLDNTCSTAELKRAKPFEDVLLRTNHFGILMTLKVVARPLIVSGP